MPMRDGGLGVRGWVLGTVSRCTPVKNRSLRLVTAPLPSSGEGVGREGDPRAKNRRNVMPGAHRGLPYGPAAQPSVPSLTTT
jgi:hypothetical protein